MSELNDFRIAILATNGFEQSELEVPLEDLREAGARVDVVSPEDEDITGWEQTDWGRNVTVDVELPDADPADYDALVLPGGQINPDILRLNEDALKFVKAFYDSGKTIAAICHAPWLLIEAGIAKDRHMTSYASIKTDVENAGGIWEDRAVVADHGIVTSRSPDDLEVFVAKITEEVKEGKHHRDAA